MLRHNGEAVCSVVWQDTSKEVGAVVNSEENKYVFMYCYQVLSKILGF